MSLKTRRKTAQQKYKTPNNKTDSGPAKKREKTRQLTRRKTAQTKGLA
jgi:hypothetical protein